MRRSHEPEPPTIAVLNLNRSDVIAYDNVITYKGSELNLTDRGTFTLRPDKGSHEHPDAFFRGELAIGAAAANPARIHVAANAGLNVVYGGQIDLNDEFLHLNIDNTLQFAVKGNLRGSGLIEGSGVVVLEHEGTAYGQKVSGDWLYPGTLARPPWARPISTAEASPCSPRVTLQADVLPVTGLQKTGGQKANRGSGLGLTTEMPGPWQIQGGLKHAWHTHGRDGGADINIRFGW